MSRKQKEKMTYTHSDKVAYRRIGDEIILIPVNIRAGEKMGVYTLNPTAALMWKYLETERTVEDLALFVAQEFEVDSATAASDAQMFIEDLISFDAVTTPDTVA